MSIEWLIYLAGLSEGLIAVFATMGITGVICGGVLTLFGCIDDIKAYKIYGPIVLLFSIVTTFIACLIPNEKSIYLIAGADMAKQSNIPDDWEIKED